MGFFIRESSSLSLVLRRRVAFFCLLVTAMGSSFSLMLLSRFLSAPFLMGTRGGFLILTMVYIIHEVTNRCDLFGKKQWTDLAAEANNTNQSSALFD